MNTQSKSLRSATALAAIGLLASALLSATPASAARVGYYDLDAGQGVAYQEAPIKAAGHTPVQIFDLSTAELASVDVLFVLNPSNFGYGAEYVAALPAIETAVNNGLVLVFADRRVTEAKTRIPGGSGISFTRNVGEGNAADRNIDIFDNTTLVTNGPGGVVTDTNLDNGNFSNHGFAAPATLPGGNRVILVRAANEAVTFSYPQGNGAVVYSTVPLDFYLNGSGGSQPADSFRNIYAPNLVDYAASLAEHSTLGTPYWQYCHSAGHSGPASCVKLDANGQPKTDGNGQTIPTDGKITSQSLPESACTSTQPATGTASVGVVSTDIAFAWDDINCNPLNDGSQSFAVNSVITDTLLGTVLEVKAGHTMNKRVRLRVPPLTRYSFINSLTRHIAVENLHDDDDDDEGSAEAFVINGGELLSIGLRNALPDAVTSAAVIFQVGSETFFPAGQTIIIEAFHNGISLGEVTRVLKGDRRTGLSALQVFTSANYGHNLFDQLVFKVGHPRSGFAVKSVVFNTTRPASP